MGIQEIRGKVKGMYPNKTWADRVNRMTDEKVMAIYYSNVERMAKKKIKGGS